MGFSLQCIDQQKLDGYDQDHAWCDLVFSQPIIGNQATNTRFGDLPPLTHRERDRKQDIWMLLWQEQDRVHDSRKPWMNRGMNEEKSQGEGRGRLSSEGIILFTVFSRNSSKVEVVNNDFKTQGEIFFDYFYFISLLHLLLLIFYCVGACWEMGSKTNPGLLRLWRWQFVALNTWLDLISFSLFISVQRCI